MVFIGTAPPREAEAREQTTTRGRGYLYGMIVAMADMRGLPPIVDVRWQPIGQGIVGSGWSCLVAIFGCAAHPAWSGWSLPRKCGDRESNSTVVREGEQKRFAPDMPERSWTCQPSSGGIARRRSIGGLADLGKRELGRPKFCSGQRVQQCDRHSLIMAAMLIA
jgi:hypothetical protein